MVRDRKTPDELIERELIERSRDSAAPQAQQRARRRSFVFAHTAITNADMSNILNASGDIIVPYAAANLQAVVSELSIDGQGQATVVWSDTLNGTARSVGSVVNVPSSLATANSLI